MKRRLGPLAVILVLALFAAPPAASEEESGSVAEAEPNDSPGAAQQVPATGRVEASVRAGGETDWFEIRFEEPAFLRAGVTGVAGANFILSVHDARNRIVTSLDGQGPGSGETLTKRLRRGTYRLAVAARVKDRAAMTSDAPYTLSLEATSLLGYEPPQDQIKAAIRRGLAWLAVGQQEDGSWDALQGDHGVTGLALMGFVGENLPDFSETMGRAAAYFKASHLPPGSFPKSKHQEASSAGSLVGPCRGGHFMYEQAIAVLAMAEYVHLAGDEEARGMVAEGIRLLLRSQNTAAKPEILRGPVPEDDPHHGGWRYTPQDRTSDLSVSGWCLIALAAAKEAGFAVPEGVRKDFMKYCRNCFDEKRGAYAYQVGGVATNTTNAIGVLTTLLCVGGECPVVRDGLRRIRTYFPNWEVEGDRGRYPFYYWYYASRAMFVAGGDYWKQWQAAVLPMLLEHQNEDGSWDAALSEEKVGVEYTTATAILILQLCSGNPPAYLKGLSLEVENYPCPKLVEDIEKLIEVASRDGRSKEDLIRQIRELMERYYGE